MPPGNRPAAQPPIPAGPIARTRRQAAISTGKYRKIYESLARNRQLIEQIKQRRRALPHRPGPIVGALIGEHTYNVDALDNIQVYYVKAAPTFTSTSFAYGGE